MMTTMAASLDFQSQLFLMYKSHRYFLPSFKSIGLSVQQKKFQIHFWNGGGGGHAEFPLGMIFAILSTSYFLSSFELIGLLVQEKFKIDFQNGNSSSHLGFLNRNHVGNFLCTNHTDTSYQLSSQLAFQFRRKNSNRFSKRWPSWISDLNDVGHLGFMIQMILLFFIYKSL